MNNMIVTLDRFRKPAMLIIDIVLVNLSIFLAFAIRFDWQFTHPAMLSCPYFMVWATFFRISLFALFGMYQWSFSYASISEAINILKSVTVGSLMLIATAFFTRRTEIGRSVLLIDYLICIFFIGISRFAPRVLVKFKQLKHLKLKRVLIVGAGAAGEMIAREMINAKRRIYQPVGFIDDDPRKLNSRMHGVKVLGGISDIGEMIKGANIEEIVIAIPSASGKIIRDIISKCEKTEVKIKTVPELHKILTGEVTIKSIRDVKPEDLLGRETVEIDTEDIGSFIRDKVILITGAAGTIGSELSRQIIKFNPKQLILYDTNENNIYFLEIELKTNYSYSKFKTVIGDIKDIGLLKNTFSKYRPQIVFHAAAHKHVPLMEDNPVAAVKNNILGTRNLIYASEHYMVDRFVMISTDKAVNPTSVMGVSKRIAEMIVQTKAKTARTKFMAVRFGNVIGSSGSVIPIFKQQIEDGKPITVTDPGVKRFFMAASEAAQLVMQAGAIGKSGEVLILDMGEQIKILDLAKNLITLSGFKPYEDVEIKFIGLRPGEKMYEETLLDIEHDRATKHDKIYIAQPDTFDPVQLRKDIKTLEQFTNLMDEDKVIEKLKEMVPSYKPNGIGDDK
ncbi:MAG: nucleoside-diphosphate sugar epimerase/dehydratase [Candidatus Omnitrophota bacterium]|jgi:FlaA1/EpsC-like NDP-sugar epimerase|nr:nucleoside-diphosphate sugar epimerase/dehydratase [Candidatus Omnitrophota bacterium]